MPDALTPNTFEPHVGSEFSIVLPEGSTTAIELATLVRQEARSHGDRTEPFSMVFVGPQGRSLAQATYAMDHATLGRIEIFIVPIGPRQDGRQQYEAVFS